MLRIIGVVINYPLKFFFLPGYPEGLGRKASWGFIY